jgi:Fur family transcriptional regulator, iron response regulator
MENADALKSKGIKPTLHRLAVAGALLPSRDHLSAEQVWAKVKRSCPAISRATVYNTLELFALKGLVLRRPLRDGSYAYDPVLEPHHHLVDEATGRVYDIPWEAVRLPRRIAVRGFEVTDFHLLIKEKKK